MHRPRPQRNILIAFVMLLCSLLVGSMAALPVLPAQAEPAASGEYTLDLKGPDTVKHGTPPAYSVTLETQASEAEPVTGIVLTAKLAEGLEFDSVSTSASSPVESVKYDKATRTVTFTLKPVTQQLLTFSFSVTTVNDEVKDSTTVYTTSMTGSPTPSGKEPEGSVTTKVTGRNDYRPSKTADVVPGTGNRVVTYRFNVNSVGENADNFTSWAQKLTDTFPRGAVIRGTSDGWKVTKNYDGSTTAVYERDGRYGPSSAPLDVSAVNNWITVYYPADAFPNGGAPPANTVSLKTKDHSGTWHDQPSATMQAPKFTAGAAGNLSIVKGSRVGNDKSSWSSGTWASSYEVNASFTSLNETNPETLESLIVEDSAAMGADNAEFFDHFNTNSLRLVFGGSLASKPLPYRLEYLTQDAPGQWKSYTPRQPLTKGSVDFVLVPKSSTDFYGEKVPLEDGQRVVGWRVVIADGDSKVVEDGAVVKAVVQGVPSAPSLADNTKSAKSVHNSAIAFGKLNTGDDAKATDDMTRQLYDAVNIITSVDAPSTISVGEPAKYTAGIGNFDVAGRSYKDSVLRVVLPVGVAYAEHAGVTPTAAKNAMGIPYPQEGKDFTVTTDTVTDDAGEHQVVILTFKKLQSVHKPGQPMSRWLTPDLFVYNIPTQVQPNAYSGSGVTADVTSWATTDDPAYADLPISFYFSFHAKDSYDFDKARDVISKASDRSVVNTAGGLLMGKLVRQKGAKQWATSTRVDSPSTAEWQVLLRNVLPESVDNVTIFDRVPAVGDGRETQFDSKLAGPVTGLPEGATVEYSTDATAADNGTWTDKAEGATAFRIKLDKIATNSTIKLVFPTTVPAGLKADEFAGNRATAQGDYASAPRSFSSPLAGIEVKEAPAFTVEKKTNGEVYDKAPGAEVPVGSTVKWTYIVKNTGNARLDEISLSDAYTAGDGSTGTLTPTSEASGPLEPGQSREFTAEGTAVAGQYENTVTAKASAVNAEGVAYAKQPKDQKAQSWYHASSAGLTVEKSAAASADGPFSDKAEIAPGKSVFWKIVVTNSGDAPLKNVTITDDSLGDPIAIGDLAVGESQTKVIEQKNVTEGYVNTAEVSGHGGGKDVSAKDSAEVVVTAPDPSPSEPSDKPSEPSDKPSDPSSSPSEPSQKPSEPGPSEPSAKPSEPGDGADLPRTGFQSFGILFIGLGLVGLGAVLVQRFRRIRR